MSYQTPGKTLLNQYLNPRKLSQNKLARAIGVPPRRINEIILGKRAITADTAVRLGVYFGNSAGYWMHLQAEHDIDQARKKIGLQLNMINVPHRDENMPASDNENIVPVEPASGNQQKSNIKRRIMR